MGRDMVARWSDRRLEQARSAIQSLEPPYLLQLNDVLPDDYEKICDEDFRCEYVDGVLFVHSPASLPHVNRVSFLVCLLRMFAEKRSLGLVFTSNAVMQIGERRFCGDVSFIGAEHADRLRIDRVIGPMDLVVEIVSKSTRSYDLRDKRAYYREAGVPEVWFVDTGRNEFHVDYLDKSLGQDGMAYGNELLTTGRWHSRVLSGLWVDVSWFWTDPLPNALDCLQSILSSPNA